MSKRPARGPAIGECPCPEQGCSQVVELRRYQERSGRGSMFKGKLFASCPTHGRVIDAARSASQEWALEKGEIWGPNGRREPAQQQTEEPAEPAQEAAREPQAEPARPAPRPALPAVRERTARPDGWPGWNLWDWLPTSWAD